MSRFDDKSSDQTVDQRRPQDRLLFWFAAALIPGAGTFHMDSTRAMEQRMELIRYCRDRDEANQTPPQREAA